MEISDPNRVLNMNLLRAEPQQLLVDAIKLLLEAESERCGEELELHRHPLRRQAILTRQDKVGLLLLGMEKADECGEEENNTPQPEETKPKTGDSSE